jgi:hypothetical protein
MPAWCAPRGDALREPHLNTAADETEHMRRRDLPRALLASAAGTSLMGETSRAQVVSAAPSFPQTESESKARVERLTKLRSRTHVRPTIS